MNNHTPGPWKVRQVTGPGYPGQIGYVIDFTDDQEQITDFVYEKADAELIAAAPDMLEALENLENDNGSIPDHAWAMVQAAIAKAKGEQA